MIIGRGAGRSGRITLTIWGIIGLLLAVDFYGVKTGASRQQSVKGTVYTSVGETAHQRPVEKKTVALTFDDGPHPIYTPRLLEGLKERGVHVTFFLMDKILTATRTLSCE